MLEWFKIGFGVGLGLTGALLVVLLAAGVVEAVDRALKMGRWRGKLKS